MSTARVDPLGLGKMSKGWRGMSWFFFGTATSLFIAYVAFFILAFGLGAGFDIDDKGTRIQKFFGSLALPALGLIFAGGALYSLFKAVSCWREKEDEERA